MPSVQFYACMREAHVSFCFQRLYIWCTVFYLCNARVYLIFSHFRQQITVEIKQDLLFFFSVFYIELHWYGLEQFFRFHYIVFHWVIFLLLFNFFSFICLFTQCRWWQWWSWKSTIFSETSTTNTSLGSEQFTKWWAKF